jgi:hypothetical protein
MPEAALHSSFVQLVMATWRPGETVKWRRHYSIYDHGLMYDKRCAAFVQIIFPYNVKQATWRPSEKIVFGCWFGGDN